MSKKEPKTDQNEPKKAKVTKTVKAGDKREAFARAYHGNGKNGRQAAIIAGYAPGSAHVASNKLLKRDDVRARIAELENALLKKYDVTAERVIEEMAALAFSNIMEFVTLEPVNPSKPEGRKHAFIDVTAVMARDPKLLRALSSLEIIDLPPMDIVIGGGELCREVLKTKVRLYDKVPVLKMLAEKTGALKPESQTGGTTINNYSVMDERALAARLAFILADPKVSGRK